MRGLKSQYIVLRHLCFANGKQKLFPDILYDEHLFLLAKNQLYFRAVSVEKSLPSLQKGDASLQNVFKKADMCKLKYEV